MFITKAGVTNFGAIKDADMKWQIGNMPFDPDSTCQNAHIYYSVATTICLTKYRFI